MSDRKTARTADSHKPKHAACSLTFLLHSVFPSIAAPERSQRDRHHLPDHPHGDEWTHSPHLHRKQAGHEQAPDPCGYPCLRVSLADALSDLSAPQQHSSHKQADPACTPDRLSRCSLGAVFVTRTTAHHDGPPMVTLTTPFHLETAV